jgi:hypothetical protein
MIKKDIPFNSTKLKFNVPHDIQQHSNFNSKNNTNYTNFFKNDSSSAIDKKSSEDANSRRMSKVFLNYLKNI